MDTYLADTSASVSVKIEEQAVSLDIYHIENNFVKFLSDTGEYISIGDDGAYIYTDTDDITLQSGVKSVQSKEDIIASFDDIKKE